MNLRDVRMVQRCQGLRFACEARQAIRICGERIRKNLQSDIAIELGITRPVDLPHAALSEGREDFVRAEARACGEGHQEARSSYSAPLQESARFSTGLPRSG